MQREIANRMGNLTSTLVDLDVTGSTGRVVDFRAAKLLRQNPSADAVPLIYPTHFDNGFVTWPKRTKKPNALSLLRGVEELLDPNETYVLVGRFSAKEERRRVAALHDPKRLKAEAFGFENHLNYFHRNGRGLPTLVDLYFRQFNGHTQVNARDLRSLRYPNEERLRRLGQRMLFVTRKRDSPRRAD